VTRNAGLLYGVGAYLWWGLSPGYFPLLLPAGALEVLAHRIVWTAVLMVVVLVVVRRFGDLRRRSRRTWLQLLSASALISVNCGTYIHAAVLRERIGRWQLLALALAAVAVVVLTAERGGPPIIALTLATSFAVYGLVKRVVDADPRVSVAVESLLALPVAGGYLVALQVLGTAQFVGLGGGHTVLMLLAGPGSADGRRVAKTSGGRDCRICRFGAARVVISVTGSTPET